MSAGKEGVFTQSLSDRNSNPVRNKYFIHGMAAGDRAVRGAWQRVEHGADSGWQHERGEAVDGACSWEDVAAPGYVWESARTQYSRKTVEQDPRALGFYSRCKGAFKQRTDSVLGASL